MLREISDRPGLSVTKVVEVSLNDSDPTSVADAHWTLARLFKYGLVADKQDNGRVDVLGSDMNVR